MSPDLIWQAQAAAWSIVWIAGGLVAREALERREERHEREGGRR